MEVLVMTVKELTSHVLYEEIRIYNSDRSLIAHFIYPDDDSCVYNDYIVTDWICYNEEGKCKLSVVINH